MGRVRRRSARFCRPRQYCARRHFRRQKRQAMSSANFKISKAEAASLLGVMEKPNAAQTSGIELGGTKYYLLRVEKDKKLMHLRTKNREPMTVLFADVLATQIACVAVGEPGAAAGDVAKGMGRIVDHIAKNS